ncbi:MAG: polyprenyl synthetase family protein [Deltaproteobacteria bacterium]|nr:polyprenyl synthetase family protein [Deltaproteobacteria bacterium]
MDFAAYLDDARARVDRFLKDYLDGRCGADFPRLKEAMAYSLLSGGKRMRPILTMAACEAAGGEPAVALPFGCATEMIHTFSLIHDDLPAMDNDDYRRNQPTNHRIFGEAHAILAGDALLTEGFRMMGTSDGAAVPPEVRLAVMREVLDAAGICGMVGGQSLDLLSERADVDEKTLLCIHQCKTARFIEAAVVAGGLVAGAGEETIGAFRTFGKNAGLAFQIRDDILGVAGESRATGKDVGSDARRGKATFPALVGVEESRRRAEIYARDAVHAVAPLGENARRLREIAEYIVARDH